MILVVPPGLLWGVSGAFLGHLGLWGLWGSWGLGGLLWGVSGPGGSSLVSDFPCKNHTFQPPGFAKTRRLDSPCKNTYIIICKNVYIPIKAWFLRAFGQLPKKRNWGQYRFFESIQTTSENHVKMSTPKKRAKQHESDTELLPASYWRCMKHA